MPFSHTQGKPKRRSTYGVQSIGRYNSIDAVSSAKKSQASQNGRSFRRAARLYPIPVHLGLRCAIRLMIHRCNTAGGELHCESELLICDGLA
eukprot:scaffold1046_cov118-Isochrysis_galbana.AAC.11